MMFLKQPEAPPMPELTTTIERSDMREFTATIWKGTNRVTGCTKSTESEAKAWADGFKAALEMINRRGGL